MKKKYIVILGFILVLSLIPIVNSEDNAPEIEWKKCFGGRRADGANSIQQTADGGYIVAGQTESADGDLTGHRSIAWPRDGWIMKLDGEGEIEWQKCLGSDSGFEDLNSIQQTIEGGYIVVGTSAIMGRLDDEGNKIIEGREPDVLIIKLDSKGEIEWQKLLGDKSVDRGESIQQTVDEGYIMAGQISSRRTNIIGHHGGYDSWIIKFNKDGNIEWQRYLGGKGEEWAKSIQQTTDGGYIIAGETDSSDGDVTGHLGESDYWIVKLNKKGEIEWQRCLGGSDDEYAESIQQTTDGGYIVGGRTYSNDGNVTGNHGNDDAWVVKLDKEGKIEWQKSLGGSNSDQVQSIRQTTDGGYIVGANTKSNDGDVIGNHGNVDFWIVKLDSQGKIQWKKTLGGSTSSEWIGNVQQTNDGGYISAGCALSIDGDVSGNHSHKGDFWIIKLKP